MKIVIAMDSFKGSMSSMEAGNAAKEGIARAFFNAGAGEGSGAAVVVKPLADGGEGTVRALADGLGGRYVSLAVRGPLGGRTTATYGILGDNRTAVMEMAEAAGLALVKKEERNPMQASTYGVGEMIRDAVGRGCREFIIGIGGSATSEGGKGMLTALGYEFLDAGGNPVLEGTAGLGSIALISGRKVPQILRECRFDIACDVENPLCGENGAVFVFGSQKGIREEEKPLFDGRLKHFADMTKRFLGVDYQMEKGAGAAGGLGFAFLSYLPDTTLTSGVELVLRATKLEQEIKDADLVLTGEGRLDAQTAMGKAPIGVARLAKKYGKKVIAFAGGVTEEAGACHAAGIDAFFPIVRGVTTMEEAMETERAKENMASAVEQVFRVMI